MAQKIQVIDYETICDISPTHRYKVQYHHEGKWKFLGGYADTDLMTFDEADAFIKNARRLSPETLYQIRKHVNYVTSPEGIAWIKDLAAMKAASPKWVEVASSTAWEALGTVPPIYLKGKGFAMGEEYGGGKYSCFKEYRDKSYGCLATLKVATETNPL